MHRAVNRASRQPAFALDYPRGKRCSNRVEGKSGTGIPIGGGPNCNAIVS